MHQTVASRQTPSLENRTVGRKVAKARAKAFWQTGCIEATYTDQVSLEYTLPQWVDHRKLYAEDSDEATEKFHRMAFEQGTSDTILVEQPREIRKRVGTEERVGDRCEERDPDDDADLEPVKKAMKAPADQARMLCINMKQ